MFLPIFGKTKEKRFLIHQNNEFYYFFLNESCHLIDFHLTMTTQRTKYYLIDSLKPIDYDEHPEKYKVISLVIVSDTHNRHDRIFIPDGDIFIHCGDFTNRQNWYCEDDDVIPQEMINFNEWLGKLPHRNKLVIGGNHELGFFHRSPEEIQSKLLTNAFYVNDQLIDVEGMSIYGCPWKNFPHDRSQWSSIPSNIDLLITHIPAWSILDLTFRPQRNSNKIQEELYQHCGSKRLYEEIQKRIHPRIHCFGHVHDACGNTFDPTCTGTLFINAAVESSGKATKLLFYMSN